MTRIGFDARAILTDHPTGIERMVVRLFEHWPAGGNEVVAYLNRRTQRKFSAITTKVFGPRQEAAWFHLALPLKVAQDRVNIFISPITQFPKLLSPAIKKVAVVYDLAYRRFPKLYPASTLAILNGRVADTIQQADHIITISHSTKKDLQEFYKLKAESISVCYPAADVAESPGPLPEEYKQLKPYLFMIGTGYGRKNMELIVPTLVQLQKKHGLRPHVIMTGKLGFDEEKVMTAAQQAGLDSQLTHLGYVDDALRTSLMANAAALFFPSFYEGFGLPVLEAMQLDCPVVCSSASSLPEAGGQAALYFDPNDANEASDQVAQNLSDQTLRNTLVKAGREHVKTFSWDRLARDFQQALTSIR